MTKVTFTHDSISKHRLLADAIKENLDVNVHGVIANVTEKVSHEVYDKHLPEGITPKVIDDLSKYHANFSKAQHIAVAETAAEIFNQHDDVKKVEAVVGVFAHGDHSNMTVDRSRSFLNNKAKEGEPLQVVKHLYITESTDHRGTSFKALKNAISLEFKDKYVK